MFKIKQTSRQSAGSDNGKRTVGMFSGVRRRHSRYASGPGLEAHRKSHEVRLKTFHCTACQALVFFENTNCLNCGRVLAFVSERMAMLTFDPGPDGLWKPIGDDQSGEVTYRLCANYAGHQVCNWAVPATDDNDLCVSCRLTHTVPDLSQPENHVAWAKLETAKRRLIYAILSLQLPLLGRAENAGQGLEFRFLSESVAPNGDRSRVLTGHDEGLITINVAEADDIYRETQRQYQHEPYRTLLGHFRHEIGHFYWDRLISNSAQLEEFRRIFGDERADYQQALKHHYEHGAPANWDETFISAYASTHPWEDWAESWAHVMHMVDALETAQAVGLSVRPTRPDEPALSVPSKPPQSRVEDFAQLVQEWSSLTYVLNNLTRGLGLADAYPFVISTPVVDKLRFVSNSMRVRNR
jgi:hypothetical protein